MSDLITNSRILYPPDPITGVCGPQPHQNEFHNNPAKVRLLNWGIRGGKSWAGACETLWQWAKHPQADGLVIAPTYEKVYGVAKKWLDRFFFVFHQINGFSPVHRFEKQFSTYHMISGGKIKLRSADDPDKLRGDEFAYAWLDEASIFVPQKDIWEILLGRMSGAQDWAWWVTTTPRGRHGIVGNIMDKCDEDHPDYWMSHRATFANRMLHPDFIKPLKDNYSPDLYKQEVLAEIVEGGGTVYGRLYSRATHTVNFNLMRAMRADPGQMRYRLFGAIDWGRVYNHFLLIVHDSKEDRDIVIDEIALDHETIERFTNEVVAKCAAQPMRVEMIYTDPTGTEWNAALTKALKRRGLKTRVWYTYQQDLRFIAYGVELLKRRLKTASGKISLFIEESVVHSPNNRTNGRGVCISLEQYRHRRSADGVAYLDKFVDDNWTAHGADTLRYYMINRYRRFMGKDVVQWS